MSLSIIVILIFCGAICNVISAIFGIGGGVLIVPVLKTLFPNYPIQMIAATSLTIVMGTALINLILLRHQHIQINVKNLLFWSVGMIIGVQLGFQWSFLLPEKWISLLFITTLLVLAIKTLIASHNEKKVSPSPKNEYIKGLLICLFGGNIAGITGIGGGSIMAPLINQLHSVKASQIALYTNAMMVIGGLGNLYGYLSKVPPHTLHSWQIGYVDFMIVGIMVCSSFVMSFFSMKCRAVLSPAMIKKSLAFILLFIAGYMFTISFIG
ncbi:sulfite exporter TauE/SafE family protein [Conservatibacter flavescens]|uniref:Probable membrane transporter protein n=1 Tax=Conservatibacter flavescens TaxID=28161 RepID=A0A2M8S5C3_9PAST|nr:sulfite exporter TauE/SafE family protein [Conservatibacter flavescens]PJG86298.1 hypothetical protein CVP05_00330 [Conservatibacter flavescens]